MEKVTEEKLVEMIQTLSGTVEQLLTAMELMSDQFKNLNKKVDLYATKLRILERQTPKINTVSKN